MYKRMNWVAMFLLGLVTCDIYALYCWYKIGTQQNDMAKKVGAPGTLHFIAVLLLSIVTLGIVPLIWMLYVCRQQTVLAQAKGLDLTPVRSAFVRWLLLLVPGYGVYVLCKNHNKICDAFSEG